ncbi:MAG: diacylglycerol kinase family lipid kinase [Phycisphaeraceae bacterium]|nr:diacylglycerol kinase family lipid kinase [Phycisphaeraceae bacterium]
MRICIIANPIAGGGRGQQRSARLEALLRAKGHTVERYLTTKSGDARQRATEIIPATNLIIVVGGDGTLNEVINGLQDPLAVPITQLPMGTANIVAREFGLPFDADALCNHLERFSVRLIDLAEANGRRFIAVLSSGFDALVVRHVTRARRGKLGFARYALPLIRTLIQYRRPRLIITIDGRDYHGAQVFVCNIRNYAGFFQIADRADPSSGMLEVCIARRGGRLSLASLLFSAWWRRVSRRKDVDLVSGREIEIRAEGPSAPFEIDGDDAGDTPVRISIQPRGLALLAPASS